MVNLPPDPNDGQPPSRLRDRDEGIAIAIAFLAIAAVLWWGWTRGQRFFTPLSEATNFLEEPLIEDQPLLDMGGDDDELEGEDDDDEGTVLPFLGREETSVTRENEATESRRRRSATARPRMVPLPVDSGGGALPEQQAAIAEPDSPATAPQPADTTTADTTTTPPPLDISDVPEDYWAYPYIVDLYEKGLLPDFPGGRLQPDNQLTRAEFAALLNSTFVQDELEERTLDFADIPNDFWAADAIQQVVDAGYMSGYPDGTFRPNELVPRYQVLVTLASGLNLAEPSNPQEILSRFQGLADLPDWARGKVAAASENKILVNYPNPEALAPLQPATRAEIMVMIHQALLSQGRVEEIASPYVNP